MTTKDKFREYIYPCLDLKLIGTNPVLLEIVILKKFILIKLYTVMNQKSESSYSVIKFKICV